MYNIDALEKQWEQYRRNKRRPWIMSIVFIFLLLGLAYLSFTSPNTVNLSSIKSYFNIDSKVVDSQALDNKSVELVERNSMLPKKEVKKEIQAKTIPNEVVEKAAPKTIEQEPLETLVDIPILDEPKVISEVTQPQNNTFSRNTQDKPTQDKPKKVHLNIIESSSLTAYKDVEERFYRSHDTDDSLFLAKSYYKKEDYKKAEYWALQTNKVNEKIEESIFIFIKSKAKLGAKNEAISILRAYIKKTNSHEAQDILNAIMNDQF